MARAYVAVGHPELSANAAAGAGAAVDCLHDYRRGLRRGSHRHSIVGDRVLVSYLYGELFLAVPFLQPQPGKNVSPRRQHRMSLSELLPYLPATNAVLNSTSACFLTIGYVFIKRQRVNAHRNCMI